ncbi:MAG: response regulator transcription factor [Bdellovibrionales bacterium]
MIKILLVDDAIDMGALVEKGLQSYAIHHAHSISEAELVLKKTDFDLLLIDVGLPDGSGFDFCLRLAQDARHGKVPRILLTALDQTSEKVYGFNCGADDYVTKPFHLIELKARVDRYIQRRLGTQSEVQVYGSFEFNLEFQRCSLIENGQKIDLGLTPTEFRLLLTLIKSEGRVLSRKMLQEVGWEANGTVIELRGVDTHVAHLRKKLGAFRDRIVSVYGQGYSFSPDQAMKKAS